MRNVITYVQEKAVYQGSELWFKAVSNDLLNYPLFADLSCTNQHFANERFRIYYVN
jgi:hypothetical protein